MITVQDGSSKQAGFSDDIAAWPEPDVPPDELTPTQRIQLAHHKGRQRKCQRFDRLDRSRLVFLAGEGRLLKVHNVGTWSGRLLISLERPVDRISHLLISASVVMDPDERWALTPTQEAALSLAAIVSKGIERWDNEEGVEATLVAGRIVEGGLACYYPVVQADGTDRNGGVYERAESLWGNGPIIDGEVGSDDLVPLVQFPLLSHPIKDVLRPYGGSWVTVLTDQEMH